MIGHEGPRYLSDCLNSIDVIVASLLILYLYYNQVGYNGARYLVGSLKISNEYLLNVYNLKIHKFLYHRTQLHRTPQKTIYNYNHLFLANKLFDLFLIQFSRFFILFIMFSLL